MKTDFYTKFTLTIIATCLLILVLQNSDIFPQAYANGKKSDAVLTKFQNQKYGLIPINADGTINVNIKSSTEMDVNISDADPYAFRHCTVPVKIEQ